MAALTASCIDLNIQGNGAYSVLKQLATIALQNGFITDSHQFLQTLLLREKMHSTGFGSGVAVPHGKSACVKQPFVLFARKAQAIDWKASDGEDVNCPESDAELARCIFDSLALLYADVLHELAQLRGEDFSQLHIVGGGCQNTLLNQLCADACGIRVIAGPVEASTLGNIGIQLMTLDELNNVDDFRQVVSTTANLTTFTPNPDSEIAHYVAQIHSTRQTKELCA